MLRFRLRRFSALVLRSPRETGLETLNFLDFVRGGYENEDYWSLVQHCRSSQPAGEGVVAVANDHKRTPSGWYDVVAGPVAAFWDQRVAMADSDQYSFHTPTAVGILSDLIAVGDPDSYSWDFVT